MSIDNAWKLDEYLRQLIHEGVTLDEDECKQSNENLQKVLHNTLLTEIKNTSPVFKKLFRELHYGGSYYENLRVKDPNEFDINAELCLPIKADLIKVVTSNEPGFARVQVTPLEFLPSADEEVKRVVTSWFDKSYLQRTMIVNWMQGVVDKALRSAKFPSEIKVRRSQSGPAITLNVNANGKEFSVDLVPVFGFDSSKWPSSPFRQRNDIPGGQVSNQKWFVVPKSPGSFQEFPSLWRLSFYNQEREMMKRVVGNMKPIIKLIKKLRDLYNWKGLSSYYIKTIFMWELSKNDERFWRQGLGFLFLHMLGKVEEALHNGRIDFFWYKKFNLIKKIPAEFIMNTENCIARLKRKIIINLNDNKPEYIFEVFGGFISSNSLSQQGYSSQSLMSSTDNNSTGTANRNQSSAAAIGTGVVVGAAILAAGIGILSYLHNRNNNRN